MILYDPFSNIEQNTKPHTMSLILTHISAGKKFLVARVENNPHVFERIRPSDADKMSCLHVGLNDLDVYYKIKTDLELKGSGNDSYLWPLTDDNGTYLKHLFGSEANNGFLVSKNMSTTQPHSTEKVTDVGSEWVEIISTPENI